jgi:hypothetical protein
MRGHIARKGNRYYAVVYEGTDPATGKERHRWYPGGATKRDAEKVLGELVKRMHDGDYRSPERITVADYLTERWLPLRRRQVRHSTYRSYVANTRLHVVPYIGSIPLQRLTPDDLTGSTTCCSPAAGATATAAGCHRRWCATSTTCSARR